MQRESAHRRGVAPSARTEWFWQLYAAVGELTYRSPSAIRDRWNSLSESERRRIDPTYYRPVLKRDVARAVHARARKQGLCSQPRTTDRNDWLWARYTAEDEPTFHAPTELARLWNALSDGERKQIAPESWQPVTADRVQKAMEARRQRGSSNESGEGNAIKRRRWFLEQYETAGQSTYRSPAAVRDLWNSLPEDRRRSIAGPRLYRKFPAGPGTKRAGAKLVAALIHAAIRDRNRHPTATRPTAARDRWMLEQYESPGLPTFHSPSEVAKLWNSLPAETRRKLCPSNPEELPRGRGAKSRSNALVWSWVARARADRTFGRQFRHRGPTSRRPAYLRDQWIFERHQAQGEPTYHSFAAIRDLWNSLPEVERRRICPQAPSLLAGTKKQASAIVGRAISKIRAERQPCQCVTRRPCFARDHLWLAWYEAEGEPTYKSVASIRDKWNGLTDEERAEVAGEFSDRLPRSRGGRSTACHRIYEAIRRARLERDLQATNQETESPPESGKGSASSSDKENGHERTAANDRKAGTPPQAQQPSKSPDDEPDGPFHPCGFRYGGREYRLNIQPRPFALLLFLWAKWRKGCETVEVSEIGRAVWEHRGTSYDEMKPAFRKMHRALEQHLIPFQTDKPRSASYVNLCWPTS